MYLSADWVALLIFAGPFFVLAFLLLARQSYENPVTLTTVLCLCASTMTGQALLNNGRGREFAGIKREQEFTVTPTSAPDVSRALS